MNDYAIFPMNLQLFAQEGETTPTTDSRQEIDGGQQPDAQAESSDEVQQDERTFTQADVDRIVADRMARARRETEQKVKKAREEGRTEAEKLAKMSAEQRAQHEREQAEQAAREREDNLVRREQEIARRELRAQALDTLREKKLSPRLADALDYSSAEACQKSIELLEGVMRDAIQDGVNERITQSRSPLKRSAGGDAALMSQVRSAMGLKDGAKKD